MNKKKKNIRPFNLKKGLNGFNGFQFLQPLKA